MIVIVFSNTPLNITETVSSSQPTVIDDIVIMDEPLILTKQYAIEDYSDLFIKKLDYEIESEDNEIIPIIWCIIIAQILYVYHHFDIDYG